MSVISAPELLRTPKGYPPRWQRIFEALTAPIVLVREIGSQASRNSWHDKAIGKNTEPWLSPDEFQRFRNEAIQVRQRMRETMEQIDGIAERTWRAACEIRTMTGIVLFPLTDELDPDRYPEHVVAGVRREIIQHSHRLLVIPLLTELRDAISAEKSIVIADPTSVVGPSHSTKTPAGAAVTPDQAKPATNVTWQEAAARLERLRVQGEPFSSQQQMAEQIHCSPATINKAIKKTPSLQIWAKPTEDSAPRAQSINEPILDRTAQSREMNPSDEAAIREFIESSEPATKAWFLALPTEVQLEVIKDPDKHQQILGRKA